MSADNKCYAKVEPPSLLIEEGEVTLLWSKEYIDYKFERLNLLAFQRLMLISLLCSILLVYQDIWNALFLSVVSVGFFLWLYIKYDRMEEPSFGE